MQNNKFEKQVQQKMEELRFSPSAEVWDKVEALLPKEKKRRWWIFILLFAVLSTTGLLWLNNNVPGKTINQLSRQENTLPANEQSPYHNGQSILFSETKPSTGIKTTGPAKNTTTNAPSANPASVFTGVKNDHKPAFTNVLPTATTANVQQPANKKENNKNGQLNNVADNPVPANPASEKKFMDNYLKQPTLMETVAKLKTTVQVPGTVEDENGKPINENLSSGKYKPGTSNSTTTSTVTKPVNKPEEKVNRKQEVVIKEKGDSSKDAIAAKTPGKKKKQPWQYSVQFGVGIPYTKNGINDAVFAVNTASLVAAPVTYIPNNQPSVPSPGKVFQTGITVEKNVVGRLDIKTGLSYMYLSNHIQVGDRIDSLSVNGTTTYNNGNGIGINSPANLYNNYFRFIQLPLALQYYVIRKEQFGLFLEGGASLDYMIKSNALLFNGATNTYATNKNIYNRMLYTGIAGIGVKTAQQSKIPVSIGYQLSYGMKPFFKEADTQKHLPISLVYFRMYLKR